MPKRTASQTSNPLNFANAPLVETALGVIFRTLDSMRAIDLAPLRELWRSEYPRVEAQSPLPPISPDDPAQQVLVRFGFGSQAMDRHWFQNPSGSELVQVQQDRLYLNWRKGTPDATYPRYGQLRDTFALRFQEFSEFVEASDLGRVQTTLAEVTYVNAIDVGSGSLGQLERVITLWSDSAYQQVGKPEQARVNVAFGIPRVGSGTAHLFVDIAPAQLTLDGPPQLLMTLTLRGSPVDNTQKAVMELMDQAHTEVLRCFLGLTTQEMHEHWGIQR